MPVATPLYPVGLVVHGRRCLVVGGGRVAARKVAGLHACGAEVDVIAPEVDDAIRSTPGVTVHERAYEAGDVQAGGWWLVVTATPDAAVNQQVYDDAAAARVWCNSADDPERCTFTLPAVHRQGPVVVAVATGGHSPALAGWLRDRIAADIGPEFATLAALLAEARAEVQAEGRSTEDLDWRIALEPEMLELIRAGLVAEARERLRKCLSSSSV
jgi:precorrin-2 dehydrogenase/sirohydrochlorin ferrochelatase